MDTWIKIALSLFFVGLNAFFVASEFALVSVRRTWVQTLVDAGHLRAQYIMRMLNHLDEYFSTLQLGITVASLALGWLGEGAFAELLLPLFEQYGVPGGVISVHAAATALSFSFITVMHILFGELVPRSAALQYPEKMVLWAVFPLMGLRFVLRPVAGVLNMLSRGILKLLGLGEPTHGHRFYSQEEIRILLEQSHKGGGIEEGANRMLTSVFDFAEKKADAIMTPRTEMVAIPETIALEELAGFIREDQHTRLPVYRASIDQIVGTLNIKHLLPYVGTGKPFAMREVIREPFFVPAMKPLGDLLKEMQHRVEHMAIVVDEFGGTVGLITMEDLLEEIVGEIFDEFDVEKAAYETLDDGDVVLDGRTNVDRVNAIFGTGLPEEEYNTIGGLVFGVLGYLPKVGEEVQIAGAQLRVEEVRARRVVRVRLARGRRLGEG